MNFKIKDYLIGVLIFIIIVLIISMIYIVSNKEEIPKQENIATVIKEETNSNNIFVDIKGEVKTPGVYQINEDAIVNDVIKLAGGLTKNAYTKNINLSKKVTPEMVIYIFSKKEINKTVKTTTTTTTESIANNIGVTTTVINYDNCLTTTISTTKDNVDTQLKENELVNINNASKEMLMNIPGIGESKADAIIIYRQEQKFATIEDIKNVSGIGDSLFVKIKDYITV